MPRHRRRVRIKLDQTWEFATEEAAQEFFELNHSDLLMYGLQKAIELNPEATPIKGSEAVRLFGTKSAEFPCVKKGEEQT